MYLSYAALIGDFERVVEHWILEEDWVNAIDAISRQSDLELYYQFGPVLMRNAPRDTVDSWIRQPALDPLRLVPALLQFQLAPRDPLSPNQATRYLNHVIFDQLNTSSTLHNLVITLHASPAAAGFNPVFISIRRWACGRAVSIWPWKKATWSSQNSMPISQRTTHNCGKSFG